MSRKYLGKYMRGRKGLKNVFKRDKMLRWGLSKKERKYALGTLEKYQGGKGISVRDAPGMTTEINKAYSTWKRDKKDPISTANARLIQRRLKRYSRKLQQDDKHNRASRSYFDSHTEKSDKDSPDSRSSRQFRGDPDDKPSVKYGRQPDSFDRESKHGYGFAGSSDIDANDNDRFSTDGGSRNQDDFDPNRFDNER